MATIPAPLLATALADVLEGRHRRLQQQGRLAPALRSLLEAQAGRLRTLAVEAGRWHRGPLKGKSVDSALAGLLVALAADWRDAVHGIADRLDELQHPGRTAFEAVPSWDIATILELCVTAPDSGT